MQQQQRQEKGYHLIIKLCDFGVSVRIAERTIVGGSPVYMSQEHLVACRHCSEEFDCRVDVGSVGVVLFEMLGVTLPYQVVDGNESGGDIPMMRMTCFFSSLTILPSKMTTRMGL